MAFDHIDHPAELVAYAVLLLTLAIVLLALALHSPAKDPLFGDPESLVTSLLLVGLLTFSIRLIGVVSRRDAQST